MKTIEKKLNRMEDILPEMCNRKYFNVLYCAEYGTPNCKQTCNYCDNPVSHKELMENLK